MQDNGRKIEKHFQNEGEDGVLDINAVVDIPDISLKEGVIQSKEWDISTSGAAQPVSTKPTNPKIPMIFLFIIFILIIKKTTRSKNDLVADL